MQGMHRFHIGDVLTVTTGVLVSPRGMLGLRGILAFITNTGGPDDTSITDTGCQALAPFCKEVLVAQHPWLATIDDSGVTKENVDKWLESIIAVHGEQVEVASVAC